MYIERSDNMIYSKRDMFNKMKDKVSQPDWYINENKEVEAKIIVKDTSAYNKIAQLAICASDIERLELIKFVNRISTRTDLGMVRRKKETDVGERKALCLIIKCCESDEIKLKLIEKFVNKIQDPIYVAYLIDNIKSEELKNQQWENKPEIYDKIGEIKNVKPLIEEYFVDVTSSESIKNDITVTEEIEQLLKKCKDLEEQIKARLKEKEEKPVEWDDEEK